MALIFISCSSKDKEKSIEIKNYISERGFDSVFLDHNVDRGICTGEEWERRLYDEMRIAHIMLILLSPAWIDSKWCFAEYTHAKASGKEMIPLIIEQGTKERMEEWIGGYLEYSDIDQDQTALDQIIKRIEEISIRTQVGFEFGKDCLPYPGMVSFEEEDASVFFGRDIEISDIIKKLNMINSGSDYKSLMILGASGMGKSSLLKAGVIPRLKRTYAKKWTVLPLLKPSQDPISDFAKLITKYLGRDGDYYNSLYAKLKGDKYREAIDSMITEIELKQNISTYSSFLLPIDQAENLYTTAEPYYRDIFLRSIIYMLDNYSNFFVIWTLRSDFLKDFQGDRLIDRVIDSLAIVPLAHISSDSIVDIISKPAQMVGLEIDSRLIDRIREDMHTTDALPLISLLLNELYHKHIQKSNAPIITLDTYQNLSINSTNPLESIVQIKAEEAIKYFVGDADIIKSIKEAFIPNLVRINSQGIHVKRVAEWSELPKESHMAIESLVNARLLIKKSDETHRVTIEVSHEALIRKWSRLQEWLIEEQEFLVGKSQLEISLQEYIDEQSDKTKTFLTGIRLQKATIWLEEHTKQLSLDEIDYIKKSIEYDKEVRDNWKQLAKDAKNESIKANHNLGLVLMEKAQISLTKKDFVTANYYAYSALRKLSNIYDERQNRAMAISFIMEYRYTELLSLLKGHESDVTSVAISPNGRIVVSGSSDNTIRVWEKRSGELLSILRGHEGNVTSVAISSDGRQIISGSNDSSIKIWDMKSGKLISTLNGHTGSVYSIDISFYGKTIISGSNDNSVKIWSIDSKRAIYTLSGHIDSVYSVAISHDGTMIVSGSDDTTIKLWDRRSGELLSTLDGHSSLVSSLAISSDGKRVVSGSWDNSIKIWDVESSRLISTLIGHTSLVNSVDITPDGKRVVSGSWDRTIKVWDVESGDLIYTLNGHTSSVRSVAISPDGKSIVSGSNDNSSRVWSGESAEMISTLQGHTNYVISVTISSDDTTIVSGSNDKNIMVWDRDSRELLATLEGHMGNVNSVAISSDKSKIVSGSNDMSIRVWDLDSCRLISILIGHRDSVYSVAITPDNRSIVSGSSDSSIKIWDISSGELLSTLRGHKDSVYSVVISPDGESIISASNDNSIRIWDISSGRLVNILRGHEDSVYSVVISRDGKSIVSGSWDNTIKIWDMESGELLSTLRGHRDSVYSVAISPDGKTIISSSWDNTIKAWDMESGELLSTLRRHVKYVTSIAISNDEKVIIADSSDYDIKVWDISMLNNLRSEAYIDEQIKKLENQLQVKLDGVTLVPLNG